MATYLSKLVPPEQSVPPRIWEYSSILKPKELFRPPAFRGWFFFGISVICNYRAKYNGGIFPNIQFCLTRDHVYFPKLSREYCISRYTLPNMEVPFPGNPIEICGPRFSALTTFPRSITIMDLEPRRLWPIPDDVLRDLVWMDCSLLAGRTPRDFDSLWRT